MFLIIKKLHTCVHMFNVTFPYYNTCSNRLQYNGKSFKVILLKIINIKHKLIYSIMFT